jgi:hypothetical protein
LFKLKTRKHNLTAQCVKYKNESRSPRVRSPARHSWLAASLIVWAVKSTSLGSPPTTRFLPDTTAPRAIAEAALTVIAGMASPSTAWASTATATAATAWPRTTTTSTTSDRSYLPTRSGLSHVLLSSSCTSLFPLRKPGVMGETFPVNFRRWEPASASLPCRSPVPRHCLPAVVELGNQPVVGSAHDADVVDIGAAPEPEGTPVVVLEAVTLRASSALRIHETASTSVAPLNSTPNRGRNMPRRGMGPHPLLSR